MAREQYIQDGMVKYRALGTEGGESSGPGPADALVAAGISKGSAAKLVDAGVTDVAAIVAADAEDLDGLGLSKTSVKAIEALRTEGGE